MSTVIKNGFASPQLMVEECAAIARACNEAASSDIHGNLPLYRALAVAFHSLTIALAYQNCVDRASEARTQEFLQEVLGPSVELASNGRRPN